MDNNHQNKKKKYRLPVFLLLFGAVVTIASAIASVDNPENWFARSGAILSFVSVVVQFLLSNIRKDEIEKMFNSNIGLKEKFKHLKRKNKSHDILVFTSGVTGLVGTLIWGYGDLLY